MRPTSSGPRFASAGPATALAVRFGAVGDLVLFTADLQRIAERHGRPVDVLTGTYGAAVLDHLPFIGRRYTLDHRRRPWWLSPDRAWLRRELLAAGHRSVYCWDRTPGLEDRLEQAGAQVRRAGQAGWDLPDTTAPDSVVPWVEATDTERAEARALVAAHGLPERRFLVVQPGNRRSLHPFAAWRRSRDLKAWPTASWVAAVTALGERHPRLGIVLSGAPAEHQANEEIRRRLPPAVRARTANLARDLPLRRLAGLLAEAAGCLSVDTGPAHLAGALGTPLVVLFGPADHQVMRPRGPGPVQVVRSGAACSPCYGTARRTACRANLCMQAITVAQVLLAWDRLGIPGAGAPARRPRPEVVAR